MKKFKWNQYKTGLVNMDKVRNFEILPDSGQYVIVAWYSDTESVRVGLFASEVNAVKFLDELTGESE